MKIITIITILSLALFSCGGKKKTDGIALANEVCECKQKLHGLSSSAPETKKLRLECSKIQGENWGKIIRDKEQEDAFNKRVNECTVEMIRNMSN